MLNLKFTTGSACLPETWMTMFLILKSLTNHSRQVLLARNLDDYVSIATGKIPKLTMA